MRQQLHDRDGQAVCCTTTPLGKGTRCGPPFHPPGYGSSWVSNPSRASGTYHRSITRRAWRRPSPPAPNHGSSELSRSPEPHSQGDFALPAPIDLGSVPAPKTPDHSMEANPARIGCRQRIGAEPDQGYRAPLKPIRTVSPLHPQSGSVPTPPIPPRSYHVDQ